MTYRNFAILWNGWGLLWDIGLLAQHGVAREYGMLAIIACCGTANLWFLIDAVSHAGVRLDAAKSEAA